MNQTCYTWGAISQALLGEETNEEIQCCAEYLLNKPIEKCLLYKCRGNSRIHQLQGTNGNKYAVKSYPDRMLDPRNRLVEEAQAFQFLKKMKFKMSLMSMLSVSH